jgi:hypothetical protein
MQEEAFEESEEAMSEEGSRRTSIKLAIAAAATFAALLTPSPAAATPSESVSVVPFASYTGGAPALTEILLSNTSTSGEEATFESIYLVPGCADAIAYCVPTDREEGLFTLSPTGKGTAPNNCVGTWNIVESQENPAVWRLVPGRIPALVLQPGETCTIDFTATANRMPTLDLDSGAAGGQTNFVVTARVYFFPGGVLHTAANDSQVTVFPKPPAAAPAATGQQAAALKKCKKKHSRKARKKCKKKAALLPV